MFKVKPRCWFKTVARRLIMVDTSIVSKHCFTKTGFMHIGVLPPLKSSFASILALTLLQIFQDFTITDTIQKQRFSSCNIFAHRAAVAVFSCEISTTLYSELEIFFVDAESMQNV